MNSRQQRVQVLYEISLSIGRGADLQETARDALSGYLRKLNCSAGAVLERIDGTDAVSYERVAATPAQPQRNDGYRKSLDALPERRSDSEEFHRSLPSTVRTDDQTAYLLDLPDFGVLVLVTSGDELDANTVAALRSLNQKLADACRAERTERRLRQEQDRFQTVFETIPEPMARVRERGGEPVVAAVNRTFAETFGCNQETVQGAPLSELVEPSPEMDHRSLRTDWATDGRAAEREVTYRTVEGPNRFIFRSVPTTTEGGNEQFCLFIDISAQQQRQETLDALVRTADRLLDMSETMAVCQGTIDAAASVLGFERAGVFLYERDREGLTLAAANGDDCFDESTVFGTGTVVWEAYQSGELRRLPDTSAVDSPLAGESALLLPLGTHGVFVTCAAGTDGFNDTDVYYGRLLTTLVQNALDRVSRERSLREIHRTTSALIAADNTAEVGSRLVEQAAETFGLPIVGIWRYDESDNALRPVANSARAQELFDDIPIFAPGNSIAWEVFESGEPKIVDSIPAAADAYNQDSALASELIVPIGDFGLFIAGSRLRRDFSKGEVELLQTLTSGAQSAFQLVEQREELDILDQILARILRHNIRNDITAIRGRAELITRRGSEYGQQKAQRIINKSGELLSTAENAREMRDVVDRRGQRTEFALGEKVMMVTARLRDEYPEAEIIVDDDIAGTLRAHPHFGGAIRHAVENGIEHTDGGDVSVSVRTRVNGDQFLLEIEDDGPGIPDHELQPLRDREETPLAHGSGTGLWIIDRVIEYSGGTATFAVGDGTTVQFRFPLAQITLPASGEA
jgi:PAS domain S-box-containing protein